MAFAYLHRGINCGLPRCWEHDVAHIRSSTHTPQVPHARTRDTPLPECPPRTNLQRVLQR